jgi:hypothetical protein
MLKAHQQETEARLHQLQEYLKLINGKIEYYEGELATQSAGGSPSDALCDCD